MAAMPTSMAELTSLITNTASPLVDSAVESLEAESTTQAERMDEVQRELQETIESVRETLVAQLTEKIESVQHGLPQSTRNVNASRGPRIRRRRRRSENAHARALRASVPTNHRA